MAVFTAWISVALIATVSVVVWVNNLSFDFNFNEPYENRDASSIEISNTNLTVSELVCDLVDDETVNVTGTVVNPGPWRSGTLTTIVRLNAADGIELSYFRTPLFSTTRLGPLSVGQEELFEISGRMAPGAETCEVEFWESDERTRLRGESSVAIR